MHHVEALTDYIEAFVTELVHSGVEDVVISPGSRSTPLAMMLVKNKGIRVHVHVDERSAAFFALGIAKASQKPTAILCTSGSAAANYFPAIVEAKISRVPLLVLTADRPHELRDVGAPQAIDQINLYGKHVKWFVEMALPENTKQMIHYVRTTCARAAAVAQSAPAGPVHLNFPFREPLIPQLDRSSLFHQSDRAGAYVNIRTGKSVLEESELEQIVKQIKPNQKGLIICGPMEQCTFADEVVALAQRLNYPLVADPLSQLRSGVHAGDHIVTNYDAFLKIESVKAMLKPDVVIRFGAMPVSKSLLLFLQEHADASQIIVDSGSGWREPSLTGSEMLYCDEKSLCASLVEKLPQRYEKDWLTKWQEINEITKCTLAGIKEHTFLSESKLFSLLAQTLPERATVFVGNSMPIRDMDTFFQFNNKSIRVMANRGANGIDGVVSTALGAATIEQPLFLIVGDLTFFHDLNGLLAAKLYGININIIVINNNGGGIFSFLPQAQHEESFEQLFGTPLNLDFYYVVKMYGGKYVKVIDWDHYDDAIGKAVKHDGLSVIEIQTDRDENLQEHRHLWENVSQEITKQLMGNKNETTP